jgi:isoleucyl-tRNA synthetase
LELTAEGVEVRRSEKSGLKVLNEGSLTVALDPEITPELLAEGLVRDMVRGIQSLRKDTGLDVTDRISVHADADQNVRDAVSSFEEYLMGETLSESFEWKSLAAEDEGVQAVAVGDSEVLISVTRIG